MPSLSLLKRSAWNVSQTCRVSDSAPRTFSCARRSACHVVKAREVATSAMTRALVKSRIFWVSPISGGDASVPVVRAVVLPELVLVLRALEGRGVEGEHGRGRARGGDGDLRRGFAPALVPGLHGVLSGRHAVEGEHSVRARARPVRAV